MYWSSRKVPFILERVKSNLIFILGFRKTTQIPNFMNIRPVGAELFHEDGWTDRQTHRHDKADSCFSNFCERPKKTTKKGNNNIFFFYKRAYSRFLQNESAPKPK